MSDLIYTSFSEFGKIITGKTPSYAFPEHFGSLYPFITPSDSFNEKYITKTNRYLSKEGANYLKNKLVPKESVVITCIGSAMGKVSMTKHLSVTNQQINTIIVNYKFDSNYLYYCLKNNSKLLCDAASGSTALPLLNKTEFEKLKCFVHSNKNTQKKIAHVLSILDDKIELNNRINAELEAMAKQLYDYWFVQFDFPDANGKPYKSSGGKMVYNKTLNREIPEGWGVTTIGEYATVKKGQLITEKTAKHGNIKVVAAGVSYSYYHSEANNKENTITVSGSGANAGIINFWREPIFASDCITVRGSFDVETILILHYLKILQEHILKQARGSAQPHVYPSDIDILNYIVIPKNLIKKFGNIVLSNNKLIAVYQQENQTLKTLRDWLLPMLMNGQVKVK